MGRRMKLLKALEARRAARQAERQAAFPVVTRGSKENLSRRPRRVACASQHPLRSLKQVNFSADHQPQEEVVHTLEMERLLCLLMLLALSFH